MSDPPDPATTSPSHNSSPIIPRSAGRAPPSLLNPTKSSAAPARVDTDTVELREMISNLDAEMAMATERELKDDIFKLSIHGEVDVIRKLLDSGRAEAGERDAEGVTALHWAAINNHYSTCVLLLDRGADVNAVGGEVQATPAMWAAQRGHYYIVALLLSRGADPMMADSSGYNLLHLATFDGNVFLLIIILHAGVPVDSRDPEGHTSLMWAAYKGFPACVDLFLRWGADIHAVDEAGFNALHWALVRGNYGCIERLVEYGVDRFLPTLEGKTPALVAAEKNTTDVWVDALEECGYDKNAQPINTPNSILGFQVADKDAALRRFFFLLPFAQIWVFVETLGARTIPWFLGLPLAVAAVAGLQYGGNKALKWARPGMKAVHKTPALAGIFAGTAFWVAVRWLWSVLPNTFTTAPLSNLSFLIFFSAAVYFYYQSMTLDPGFVPKPSSQETQKEIVTQLIAEWKYDENNFCTRCMIQRPLRSKHCRPCDRCVAKHDHHCPWIFNCVGAANHRHFFVYIAALEIGILFLIRLGYVHFSLAPGIEDYLNPAHPAPGETPGSGGGGAYPPTCADITPVWLCRALLFDPRTLLILFWSSLQLSWVTMLLIVQLLQIARAKTTYESMHSTPHSHPAHRHPHHGSVLDDPAPHSHQTHLHTPFWKKCTKMLGVDVFLTTAKAEQRRENERRTGRRNANPWQSRRGVRGNCEDFWGGDWGEGTKGVWGGRKVDWAAVKETPRAWAARDGGEEEEGRGLLAGAGREGW